MSAEALVLSSLLLSVPSEDPQAQIGLFQKPMTIAYSLFRSDSTVLSRGLAGGWDRRNPYTAYRKKTHKLVNPCIYKTRPTLTSELSPLRPRSSQGSKWFLRGYFPLQLSLLP